MQSLEYRNFLDTQFYHSRQWQYLSQLISWWLRRQSDIWHGGRGDIVGNSDTLWQSDGHVRSGRRRLRLSLSVCRQRAVDQTSRNVLQLAGARVVRQLATVTRWRRLWSDHQPNCFHLDVGSCRRAAGKRRRARRRRICVASRHQRQLGWYHWWQRWLTDSMWQRVIIFLQYRRTCRHIVYRKQYNRTSNNYWLSLCRKAVPHSSSSNNIKDKSDNKIPSLIH